MRMDGRSKASVIFVFFPLLFLLVFYNSRGFAQNPQIKTAPAGEGNKVEEKKKPIRIISPLADLAYNPGQEIDLEIEADEKIKAISVVITSGEHFILQDRPFLKRITIPENFNGAQISVIAVGIAQEGVTGIDVVSIKVNFDRAMPFGSFLPPTQDSGSAGE